MKTEAMELVYLMSKAAYMGDRSRRESWKAVMEECGWGAQSGLKNGSQVWLPEPLTMLYDSCQESVTSGPPWPFSKPCWLPAGQWLEKKVVNCSNVAILVNSLGVDQHFLPWLNSSLHGPICIKPEGSLVGHLEVGEENQAPSDGFTSPDHFHLILLKSFLCNCTFLFPSAVQNSQWLCPNTAATVC